MQNHFHFIVLQSPAARRRWLRLGSVFCAILPLLAPAAAYAIGLAPIEQADAGGTAVNVADSSLGQILVDANGMTLYMFDQDTGGVSTCYDGCAQRWPPLLVAEGAEPVAGDGVTATLGVTVREDGSRQVMANDLPLYYWFEDVNPGDVLGQAVGDVWWVLGPDGSVNRTAPAEATAEATEEAAAEATEEATAEATEEATAEATEEATAEATAEATEEATAEATEEATAEATAEATEEATAEAAAAATEEATAEAMEEATAEATEEATAEATAEATTDAAAAAPEQLPVTGGDAGMLGALVAAFGVLAGGWVALRSRKR